MSDNRQVRGSGAAVSNDAGTAIAVRKVWYERVPVAMFVVAGIGAVLAIIAANDLLLVGAALTAAAGFMLAVLLRQRATQRALRGSEARFRALSALGSDWYWETDPEYRLIHVSEGLARLSGRAGSEFLGKPCWQNPFVTPVGSGWGAHKTEVSRRAPFRDLLLRYVSAQGLVAYGSISGEPVFGKNGSLSGYRGVGNDVTAEVVLRQRLRMQHDVTRILSQARDSQLAIREVIETICRTMEWSWGAHRHVDPATAVLGCGAYWLAPGVRAKAFVDFALQPKPADPQNGSVSRAIMQGGIFWVSDHTQENVRRSELAREAGLRGAVFVPVRRGDATTDALEFFSERIEAPDQVLLDTLDAIGREVGQFMDRHEAQRSRSDLERERRHLLELLELQLEHMPIACILQDQQFGVVYCNPAAERIFGYTVDELRGVDFEALIVPDAGLAGVDDRRARLRSGDRGIMATTGNRRKDGSSLTCEWNFMPLYGESGDFSGALATAQDVTERMRMMAALEESEERYRQIFAATPLPMWVTDAHVPRFLAVNDAAVRKYGYSRSEFERMTAIDLQAEDCRDAVTRQLLARDPAQPMQFLRRHLTRDGKSISVEITAQPFQYGGQQARLILANDVTEQVENEARMIESEARYRQIFALTPLPMYLRDEDTLQFIDVNKACHEMYGYSREEMLRMSLIDIQTPAGRERYMKGVYDRPMGAFERLQKQHARRDGSLIDVEIHSYPTTMAGRKVRLVLIRDMTEQLNMERLLRDNEARLRAIADNVPATIAFFDADSALQYSNFAFDRWFAPGGEGGGSPEPFGEGLMPLLERALLGEEVTTERAMDTRAGQRVVRMTLIPHRKENGGIEGAYLMGYDLTDFRRAEAEVRHLNAELEQRVEQRTRALAAANRELESFSYSVSHDLRAPLRTIDGFSQILIDEYSDVLDESGRGYLERVRAGSQRMAKLIEDLLELARVTRRDLQIRTCDLSAMAREIFRDLQALAPERAVRVEIADGMRVAADEGLLRIALDNLMRNAWKFTGLQDSPLIEIGCAEDGESRTFFVRDNGVGFDMAYVDKLFGAFQRLHSETEFQGTGIGLALVQRVIRRHGGQVWAEAEPDRGATFYFLMPGTVHAAEPVAWLTAGI